MEKKNPPVANEAMARRSDKSFPAAGDLITFNRQGLY